MTLATHKWTRTEYQRMIQLGLLRPEDRVELIKGDVVDVAAHDPLHSNTLYLVDEVMRRLFGDSHGVRVQLPLGIGRDSEPEPDLCLIPHEQARRIARERKHPDRADLVIEIASSSLAYDRGPKASLYAEGGVPHYGIVNLVQGVLEVYSEPSRDQVAPFEWRYATCQTLSRSQSATFLGRDVPVNDLFLPDL
ncbi:MAG: Uma2 family endonuclease [Candidatus Eremiobacterota bacterium]